VCVCSLSYPACKEHAPYYVSSVACLFSIIFSTLAHKRQDFRNKKSYENINVYFDFAYNFFLTYKVVQIFPGQTVSCFHTNSPRHICTTMYFCLREEFSEILSEMYTSLKKKNTRYSCLILMELEFSRQIFEKCSRSNFIKIHPVGAKVFHADERTDRHDEANSRFSQFCARAKQYAVMFKQRPIIRRIRH
jgi:hypothetical protein